jgi:tripartite-type tricarboxylate transporter receptor subunit TctC
MKLPLRLFSHLSALVTALTALSVTLSGHCAWSQTARTMKIVVPAAPGGGADTFARLLGEQIGRAHGQTIVIENRAGAGTVIGTEAVSRAAPDGNTLLLTTPDMLVSQHLRNLKFDLLTSFEPICDLASVPMAIVVNSASPYLTLAELLNAARAMPGDLTLAGLGPATAQQLAFEMLKRATNVNITFLPYPGTAPAISALLGEHITSVFAYSAVLEQLIAGKLRALAVLTRTRIDTLPNVPTVAESGYKDVELNYWFGTFAPANTPKEKVSQLASWFTAALQAPDFRAKLVPLGLFSVGMCGADFGAFLRKQNDDFGRVIREANIK